MRVNQRHRCESSKLVVVHSMSVTVPRHRGSTTLPLNRSAPYEWVLLPCRQPQEQEDAVSKEESIAR